MSAQPTDTAQALERAILTADIGPHYLSRAVCQPVTWDGVAMRINEMFDDRLYSRRRGNQLVWLADESIPTDVIRSVLQTVAADRVLALMQGPEADMAAARHTSKEAWILGEPLRSQPTSISFADARRLYAEAARQILSDLDRDLLGLEISETF